MKKKFLLIIPVVIVLAVGGFFYIQLNPPTGPSAQLMIEKGSVQYSSGNNAFSTASNGMEIRKNYVLRTSDNSEASILLRESSEIRLDENTEIEVLDIVISDSTISVNIEQRSGRSWSQILKMSAFDDYELNAGSSGKTTEGSFSFEKGDKEIWYVDSGSVSVVANGRTYSLSTGQSLVIDGNDVQVGGAIQNSWINANSLRNELFIEEIKSGLKTKYSFLLDIARREGLTEEQADNYLDGYVRGTFSSQEAIDSGIIPEQYVGIVPEELKRY